MSGVIERLEKQHSDRASLGRGVLVVMHRWAGLFLAVFLFISGLTGAIIWELITWY